MTLKQLNQSLAPAFMELRIWDSGSTGGSGREIVEAVKRDCQVVTQDNQSVTIVRYSAVRCEELMGADIYMITPDDSKPDQCLVLMY